MTKEIVESSLGLTEVLAQLDQDFKNVSFLTSTEGGWDSLLAWNPADILACGWDENADGKVIDFVERNQKNNRYVIGFVAYDYGYPKQVLKRRKSDKTRLPGLVFYSYDNYVQKNGGKFTITYTNAKFAEKMKRILKASDLPKYELKPINFKPSLAREDYDLSFNKALNYIKSGHVYQINLAHALKAETHQNPRQIFYSLTQEALAGMMCYQEGPGYEILSVSPERFIRINERHLETFPIKGTRKKGQNKQEDQRVVASLITNQKELSELNMITDLLRNDVSKVCEIGSVRVEQKREVQELAGVFHTYSKVVGTLKDRTKPIEAFLSMFPGGSITGCPKKRAMEIIDELEATSRGAYCGSMVRIDPDGNLDSNILIRTIIKEDQQLSLPVGGGIVFDSRKSDEYQETLDKAAPLIRALS